MSGVAALLAGRVPPGVYRWQGAFEVDDIRHAVQVAGQDLAYVDGWRATTKAEVLAALGEVLDFPDTYGQNLDALEDCLRETVRRPCGVLLLWDGWGTLAHADRRTFSVLLDILAERAAIPGSAPFSALLRGEGPDIPGLLPID